MKLNSVIDTKDWHQRSLQVGYGTRDKTVIKRIKRGRVYFLVKTYDKDVGELRSEVCASNIGRLFGFPVQQTWLCRIPQHTSLGLRHSIGVVIQLDVRRQKETRRGKFREDLIHADALISLVDKNFAKLKDLSEKRKAYTLQVVIKALRNYVEKHPGSEIIWEQFFELLTFDALIGGTDRHYNNWGVLEKADSGKFLRLTPAFDNGVSLMWKMDEYKTQFKRDILIGDFIRRPKSMFKKPGSGKYGLFEILEVLYKLQEYKDSNIAQAIFKRISAIRESRIRSVLLNNVPKEKDFRSEKEELDIVASYVKMRLDVLRQTLSKIIAK